AMAAAGVSIGSPCPENAVCHAGVYSRRVRAAVYVANPVKTAGNEAGPGPPAAAQCELVQCREAHVRLGARIVFAVSLAGNAAGLCLLVPERLPVVDALPQ